jgi:hypothetical protein
MRYDDVLHSRSLSGFWFRFKLRMAGHDWFRPVILPDASHLSDFSQMTDHQRRDIGLPEPVRYMDWKELQDRSRW